MFETVDEVIMNKDFISLIEGKYDDELFKKAQ